MSDSEIIRHQTIERDTRGREKADRDRRVKEWINEQRRMIFDTASGGRPSELLVSKKLFRDLHEYAQEKWDRMGEDTSYGDAVMQGEDVPLYFRQIQIVSY